MPETKQQRQSRFLERDIERKATEQQFKEGIPALLPKAAWMAGLMAPSSGITDTLGLYPKDTSGSGEMLPSFGENIQNKQYLDALYQSLGLAGDVAYASAPLTGGVGLLAGTALKGAGAAGKASKAKGIASLADKKELVKAIKEKQRQAVRKYATDEGGDDKFISPTLEALIKRAPQNLKGKQISQWLDANANKGVKPRELEYLGIDEYIANNPNAKVSEVVEGVSENKVKIRKNYFEDDSDYRPTIDFETSHAETDPLTGENLWDFDAENIKYDIDQGDEFMQGELLDHYNAEWKMDYKSFDEIPETMHDEVIHDLAHRRYQDNPDELIEPVSTGDIDANIGDKTFAFGNKETGYSIFVDGRRIDLTTTRAGQTVDNTPYSRTEAQMELRNAMEERGDPLRIEGEYDDYYGGDYLHKQYVDENLPGGSNYREVSFSWANAPKSHNIGHIDDENQVTHALVRDRVLDDGTDTLHIDELQSDLHKEGSKFGYEPTPKQKKQSINEINDSLKDTPYSFGETGSGRAAGAADVGIKKPNPNVEYTWLEGHDFVESDRLEKVLNEIKKDALPNYIDEFGNLKSKDKIHKMHMEDIKESFLPLKDRKPESQERVFRKEFYDDEEDVFNVISDIGIDKAEEVLEKLKPLSNRDAVPNYPFKEDWYNTGLKELLFDAIRDGKDALSISTSAAMKGRYTDRYHKFYESLYDQKIPSAMKKLAKKYGGEFRKGSLDMADTFGYDPLGATTRRIDYAGEFGNISNSQINAIKNNTKANTIKITPKMREKIIAEGLPSFGYRSGGMVDKAITGGSRYI